MSEDREQERNGNDEEASRPSGAAARRERRASARSSAAGRGSAGSGSDDAGAATTEPKGRATPARDGRQQGRTSPIATVVRFVREVVAELRKVIWPTRKSLVQYTLVVLVFSVVMVSFIAGVDLLFARGVLWLFG
ncbi:preprotein translocase subunit SecE [Allosaccharopolyspora coralli]|uniref:Protein translocase subunit SecE n=1 Tax=Allosaccharopolyspora coralli TaxID=2665642 RepID=A0A5Q3QA76_9PSEU|nr:preprotein translocase subunit SecE [Allosaccharopolyspora coralli]QGK71561.1 preprotein translocase subunit SecE [Allosaccharopolyspora coralli]